MPFPSATFAAANYSLTVFLFDGDSLSRGVGASDPTASNLHSLMSAESNFTGKGRFESLAVGGRPVSQMVTEFNATKAFRAPGGHGFLFIWGGAAGTSVSTFTDLQAYWALARADGWKVVASTILPQADDSEPEAAQKNAFNLAIRSASSEWDYLIDVANVLEDPNDPLFFSDTVHLTSLGYQTIADHINATLSLPVL